MQGERRAAGLQYEESGNEQHPSGYLRLCHRQCYVTDLQRNWEYIDAEEDAEDERLEAVPCHRYLGLERVHWPALHHWIVKEWELWKEQPWSFPMYDVPWPTRLSRPPRMLEKSEGVHDRAAEVADEESRVGMTGAEGGGGMCPWFLRPRRGS